MILPNGQFRFVFTPKDYEASVWFYRDGLGLPIDHDWDYGSGDRGTVFVAGSGMVELLGQIPGTEYQQPCGGMLLMQVEDVDWAYKQLGELKMPVILEPTTFPWGQRILRLEDPDGIVVSLFSEVTPEH